MQSKDFEQWSKNVLAPFYQETALTIANLQCENIALKEKIKSLEAKTTEHELKITRSFAFGNFRFKIVNGGLEYERFDTQSDEIDWRRDN